MKNRSFLHKVFEAGIILKGVDAVLEMMGGVSLFIISRQSLGAAFVSLTQRELAEDPHDAVSIAILHWGTQLSLDAKTFGAVYLLMHGLVKALLVFALLRKKAWAYPAMILFLLLFSAYQVYRYSYSGSAIMAGLTVFDLLLAWLVWNEYRRRHMMEA